MTTDLAEFLRARYAEARAREEGKWAIRADVPFEVTFVYEGDGEYVEIGRLGRRMSADEFWKQWGEPAPDPGVLADLDSKLTIVEAHPITRDVIPESPDGRHGFGCATCHQDEGLIIDRGWCTTLRALGSVYASHPHYREEWRP
jgi:hypothetical protein